MKNIIYTLIFIIFFQNCSFDNKTGIWKDSSEISVSEKKSNDNKLEDAFIKNKKFEKEQEVKSSTQIEIDKSFKTTEWPDDYFNLENNISNISYTNKKQLISKFKFSKYKSFFTSDEKNIIRPLIYNEKIIFFDSKGTIYTYSLKDNKKISQFNFYKNKFKKIKKEIYISIDEEKIFVADNLGYLYVLDVQNDKLIWAKNFGVPFRSNIKVTENQIFVLNQENVFYSINKLNGEKNWEFATTPKFLKSKYINNIIVDKKNNDVFFLNTNGEMYSINYFDQKVNWVLNFTRISLSDDSGLFFSSPLAMKNESIIVSTGNTIQNINKLNGSKEWSKNLNSEVKPILTKNNVFIVTSNHLLVCLDRFTGEILWSKNIIKQSQKNKRKYRYKNIDYIKNLLMVDNKIFLFSNEGFLLSFDYKNGNLISVDRIIKSKLISNPIFVNNYMYLFNKNYQLFKFQ